MNRVLAAERAAVEAVAECEAQAAALLEATQQQVRRIHGRTDARLGQLHTRCTLALDRQVETLLHQGDDDGNDSADDAGGEVLQAAITRLAESLTGGSTHD